MKKKILALVISIAMLVPVILISGVGFQASATRDYDAFDGYMPTPSPTPAPNTASANFGTTQGYHQWYYQGYIPSPGPGYVNMTYLSGPQIWQLYNPNGSLTISSTVMVPNSGAYAVRKWVAPSAGDIKITGNVKKNVSGGDGVNAGILKNTTSLWSQFIAGTDTTGYNPVVNTTVSQGDAIYFRVSQYNTATSDATYWNPTITYTVPVDWSASRYEFDGDYLMNLEEDTTPTMFINNLSGLIRDDTTIEILDPDLENMLDAAYDDDYVYLGTGFTVKVKVDGVEAESYTVIYRGDCSGDGYIDGGDMLTLVLHFRNDPSLTGVYLIAANVNSIGDVDYDDYTSLSSSILGTYTINQMPLPVKWYDTRYMFDTNYLMNLQMDTTPAMFAAELEGNIWDGASVKVLDPNSNDMLDVNYNDAYEFIGTGFTVEVYVNTTKVETYSVVYRGDCTNDGYIDGADLFTIRRDELNIENTEGEYFLAADADKDSFVDADDSDLVEDYILGTIQEIDQTPLPVSWFDSQYVVFNDSYLMNFDIEATPNEFIVSLYGSINPGTSFEILDPDSEDMLDVAYDDDYEFIGTGFVINEYVNTTLTNSKTAIVRGDCNGDGYIDGGDLYTIARHINQVELLTGIYFIAGDADEDGDVDSSDSDLIEDYMLGTATIGQMPLPVAWSESRYMFDGSNLMNLEMDTTTTMFLESLIGLVRDDVSFEILDPDNENMLSTSYDDDYEFIGTGFTIKVYVDSTLTETYTVLYRGDCSGDGYIDGGDLYTLNRHLQQVELLTGIYLEAADADKDSDVDNDDYTAIQNYILYGTPIDQTP